MPNRAADWPVIIPTAAMEIVKLYLAASVFYLLSPLDPLPLLPSSIILFAAIVLSRLLQRISSRLITRVLLHLIGCAGGAALVLNAYPGLSFQHAEGIRQWLGTFSRLQGLNEWFALSSIILWTVLFWFRGAGIGKKEPSHRRTLNRFDIGILLFLYIYILQLGIRIDNPYDTPLAVSYLLFSMWALFAARNRTDGNSFTGRRSMLNTLFLFTAAFIISALTLRLLWPLLSRTALGMYKSLGAAAEPAGPWIIGLLRILFGLGFRSSAAGGGAPSTESGTALAPPPEPGPAAELFAYILLYGMMFLLFLLLSTLLGYGIWRLFKALGARNSADVSLPTLSEFLRHLLILMKKFPGRLAAFLRKRMQILLQPRSVRTGRPEGEGAFYFKRLTIWARRSGVRIRKDETAAEFGKRISLRFPGSDACTSLIIQSLELEYYGNRKLPRDRIAELQKADKNLRRLSLVPDRILNRLRPSRLNIQKQ